MPALGNALRRGNGAGLNPTSDCGVDGISEALLNVATERIHALIAGDGCYSAFEFATGGVVAGPVDPDFEEGVLNQVFGILG